MEKLFEIFNRRFSGSAKLAVIGGEARRRLARDKGFSLPDPLAAIHFDVLIELSGSDRKADAEDIFDYFQAERQSDICYAAESCGQRIEFVGIIKKGKLFTVDMMKMPPRPDLTIERFGYRSDGTTYDESGRGWKDFDARRLVLMNGNLFMQKYLKILSLKFQTGFDFEAETAKIISEFEKSMPVIRRSKRVFAYNRSLYRTYGHYEDDDPYKIGIHVALAYLRVSCDPGEVTQYIESRPQLAEYIDRAGVDYRLFELQARSGDF